MKKLMIAAFAVVACATMAQASKVNWKTNSGQYVYNQNSSTKLAGAAAYLFDAAAVSQSALVEAFAKAEEGKFDLSSYTHIGDSKNTSTTGALSTGTSVAYGETPGDVFHMYFAALNADGDLYISDVQDYTVISGSTDVTLKFAPKASSQKAAMDAKAGYTSEGWYTAVPEPTSGLLLLLGVAGLALRRRRA